MTARRNNASRFSVSAPSVPDARLGLGRLTGGGVAARRDPPGATAAAPREEAAQGAAEPRHQHVVEQRVGGRVDGRHEHVYLLPRRVELECPPNLQDAEHVVTVRPAWRQKYTDTLTLVSCSLFSARTAFESGSREWSRSVHVCL